MSTLMKIRGRRSDLSQEEILEINAMRMALGMDLLAAPKHRTCLRCRRGFMSEIARICPLCKEHSDQYKSLTSLSGYDVI